MKKVEKLLCLVLLLLISSTTTNAAATAATTKPGCAERCGNISVPFPFGIDDPDCAINHHFLLKCNAATPSELLFRSHKVSNISLEDGTISAYIQAARDCYHINETGDLENDNFDQAIDLGDGPFGFSATRNKFIAMGCDSWATMTDKEHKFTSGCISFCYEAPNMKNYCSGIGCCETTVPHSLKTFNISVISVYDHGYYREFNPCGYAFLVDKNIFKVSDFGLANISDADVRPPTVIEWVVKEENCDKARSDSSAYACTDNTDCLNSENGQGYRCRCKQGFEGNPYLPPGCKDIDECEEPERFPCKGKCKNTIGNYTCHCPLGMHGDGKVGCQGFRITTIVAVIAAITSSMIISLLMFMLVKSRRKDKNFFKNGGMLLKTQRVKIFSEAELSKATNNYDKSRFLGEGGFGSVYKGELADGNIQVAVKKPKEVDKVRVNEESQHEIAIVSQVNHKNVVKLLGLCLETKVPILVYEFISNGTLYQHIHDKKSTELKTWKARLRVAAETALALDYLHSLAYPPIIHSDVKSTNILLDDTFIAKVSDFGASVLISTNTEAVIATKIQGTLGYLDPEYLMTGILTTKSDVYSFGVVLLELLSGEKPSSRSRTAQKGNIIQHFISSLENNTLDQLLDFEVSIEDEMEEIEIVADLAKRCIHNDGMKRPTMKEVADELSKLRKLHEDMSARQNSGETERLLKESSCSSQDIATANVNKPNTYAVKMFGIESYGDNI